MADTQATEHAFTITEIGDIRDRNFAGVVLQGDEAAIKHLAATLYGRNVSVVPATQRNLASSEDNQISGSKVGNPATSDAVRALEEAATELVSAIDKRWEGETERKRANSVSPRIEDAIVAVRAALSSLSATETGWRSMDSAPVDGKHVILAVPSPGGFIYSVQGAYHAGKWNCAFADDVHPLAWMPNVPLPKSFPALPPLPEGGA